MNALNLALTKAKIKFTDIEPGKRDTLLVWLPSEPVGIGQTRLETVAKEAGLYYNGQGRDLERGYYFRFISWKDKR